MTRPCTERLGILKKREDAAREQFVQHWMGTHATPCKKLPRLRRYPVNLVDRERFSAFGHDGFSELCDSEEDQLADLPTVTAQVDPIISGETQMLRL